MYRRFAMWMLVVMMALTLGVQGQSAKAGAGKSQADAGASKAGTPKASAGTPKASAGTPKTDASASKAGGASKPLATQELDVEGVVAEVIESTRKGDMLTVRVRLRNNGASAAKVMLAGGGVSYHNANYIVAGNTKYEIMRDTSGSVIATPRDGGGWLEAKIAPKGTFNWWAKYPAPPASQKTYTLYLNVGPPIEDVPIIDKE